MGFLDRLLGREEDRDPNDRRYASEPPRRPSAASTEDERALERYRYLVRTAPPERIEQAHEEAFAKLTPEQRRLALEQVSREVPEEPARGDDPRSLARLATRAELRRPGTVERAFGGGGMGMGMGGMGMGMGGLGLGAGLLGSFTTAFVGTLAAEALFSDLADGELFDGPDDGGDQGDADGDYGDGGGDYGDAGDYGGADVADAGGDFGGDFGGGDFGGDGGF